LCYVFEATTATLGRLRKILATALIGMTRKIATIELSKKTEHAKKINW